MSDRLCSWCKIGHFQRTPWLYTYQCDECGTATVIEEERRICCIVPFCRRTRGDRKGSLLTPGMEWICGEHWRLVPGALKARRAKLRRMRERTDDFGRLVRIRKADMTAWEACKKKAVERAVGI